MGKTKDQKFNEYQGLFILDVPPAKETATESLKWLTDTIGKQGGTVTHSNEWGKKRLVYPIQKKRDGFYVHIDFKLEPAKIESLQGQCRLYDDVLKYMIMRKDNNKPRKFRVRRRPQRNSQAEAKKNGKS